jgi:hypothetical protein
VISLLLPKLAMLAAGLAAVAAVYLGVRRSGRQAQQAADARETLDQVEKRDAVEADTAGKSDTTVADELRDRWTR